MLSNQVGLSRMTANRSNAIWKIAENRDISWSINYPKRLDPRSEARLCSFATGLGYSGTGSQCRRCALRCQSRRHWPLET